MELVALLVTPRDAAVRADIERWGCAPVVEVPASHDVRFIQRRVERSNVMVFASPRRRWAEVMFVLRVASRHAPGYVSLRFYQPTCTIDVRPAVEGVMRFNICPLVAEYEAGSATKAAAIRKAVGEGFRDLAAAETRAVKHDIALLEAAVAKMGRAA